MIVLLEFNKQKTKSTINGYSTEHRTTFLNKLSFKEAILYLESESKKQK